MLAKSVLDFFVRGVLVDGDYRRPGGGAGGPDGEERAAASPAARPAAADEQQFVDESDGELGRLSFVDPPTGRTMDRYVRSLTGSQLASRMETTIDDAGLIESCYFVPETAGGWSVLQEMRRRRVHMAVVVDEYGGTEGLVSLEDIVEEVRRSKICCCCCVVLVEILCVRAPRLRKSHPPRRARKQVVGEIYDEDDEDDFVFAEDSIELMEDGTFLSESTFFFSVVVQH